MQVAVDVDPLKEVDATLAVCGLGFAAHTLWAGRSREQEAP